MVGFSQSGEADQWRRTMLEEMKRELFFHPNLQFVYRETKDSVPQQVEQVDELLKSGIDLLIISATDAKQLAPIVSKVYLSGIPVIVLDRSIASPNFTNHIGADNTQIGVLAAKYLSNILPAKSQILEITGRQFSSPAIDRAKGFDSIMASKKPASSILKINADWTEESAQVSLQKMGADLANINGIFAHNDVMARAAAKAMQKISAKKIPIIGVDALPGEGMGLDLIQKGIITGSVIYPTGGKEAIRNAALLAEGKKLPKQTILKTALIDSSNVETMELQLEKISNQQEDILQQQKMLEAQHKIYKNQRTFIMILIVFLLLFLMFSILLWYSRVLNKRINKALQKKNQDISDKNEQINKMSQEAQEAHDAKINFYTKISHEFRTPLSLIITPVDELITNTKISREIKPHLSLIKKNAYRLLQLVTQLMDLRKIEFGKFQLKVRQDDIIDFAQDILNSFNNLAQKKSITTHLSSAFRSLKCYYDPYVIEKVLLNLLSNAFKYTPSDGYIQLTIQEDKAKNRIVIIVQDSGEGMDEEVQKQLFSFFHDNHQRSVQSNGIGLSLVRELVHLHHGDVNIESNRKTGTSVSFWIPLVYEYTSEEYLMTKDKTIAPINSDIFTSAIDVVPPIQLLSDEKALIPKREKLPTILLVEDNDDLRKLLQKKLSSQYDVIAVSNGLSALKSLYEVLPDIIVCDIMLPDIDGFEITKRCKSDIKTSYIPIILLTANGSEQQYNEGLKNLANAYLTKPFHFELLTETIKNLLINTSLLKDHFTSLGNTHIRESEPQESVNNKNSKTNRKFINEFVYIVEQNLSNDQLNVQMICDMMHISRVQLFRKVKLLMDTNVNEYILNARILKAKSYLLDGQMTIAEVASKTGFSSSSYFSTAFKKITGVSPSDINKRNK